MLSIANQLSAVRNVNNDKVLGTVQVNHFKLLECQAITEMAEVMELLTLAVLT